MHIECRPLSSYPVPETRNRRQAQFHRKVARQSATLGFTYTEKKPVLLSDTLDLLEREVTMIGCQRLIIEADFREQDIRLDGWPKASARPRSPRVVISLLESQHGPLRYPCDSFDRFEDNVRAVALALEALRMVDRYGVTRRGEQYAGWKALPPSTGATMTAVAAAELIESLTHTKAATVLADAQLAREAFRQAVMKTHPDRGGDAEQFHQVQTARKVLTAHHGVSL